MDNPSFSDIDDSDGNDSTAIETASSYKGEMIFALTAGGVHRKSDEEYLSSNNTTASPSPEKPKSSVKGTPERPQSSVKGAPERPQSSVKGTPERPKSSVKGTPERPQSSVKGSPKKDSQDWPSPPSLSVESIGASPQINNPDSNWSAEEDSNDRNDFGDNTTSEILKSTGKRLLQRNEENPHQQQTDRSSVHETSSYDSFDKPTFDDDHKHCNSYNSINSNAGYENAALSKENIDTDEAHECFEENSREINENNSTPIVPRYQEIETNHETEGSLDKLDHDKSNQQTIETSKEMTTYTNENSYSDGYFDQSIDKIYERYNKSKCIEENRSRGSSDEVPTGCFDDTKDTQNGIQQMSFFKRWTQKKYIVLSSTALCMVLAATLAVILTINVFHVTGHNRHYHGDVGKTAENTAEMYQKAAISSDSGNCSRIGVEILRKNGSAVDAAITAAFCIGVTNRHASGIGGGGYMLVYNRANKSFEAFDFRETAPGRIQSGAYEKDINASRYGGMAIGVPGEVRGLYTVWKKYGKLPWKDLIQPAIDLARFGVTVTPSVHYIISCMVNMIQTDPGLSKLLLNNNGEALEVGSNMVDEELAETLKVISEKPDDFYTGELAAKVVEDVSEAGGLISFDDLASYRVLNREVVHDTIDDFDLHTIGAPTGGPVVIALLNILKGYKLKPEDIEHNNAALTYHRLSEAMKFAFALKTKEGDPSFYGEYMKELVSNMTNEEFGLVLRRKINDSMVQNLMYYDPVYRLPNENGTSHISVITENGDAVALTTTINQWYGSLNRSLRTGIIYNNEMNDFTSMEIQQSNDSNTTVNLPTSPINSVHSGKRPVSSTSPIIMTDTQGDVRFVIGGTGGLRIIPSVAQVIINKLWFKDDLGTAMSRPRIYNFLQDGKTYIEPELENIIPDLQKRNHTLEIIDPREYTAVQAIYIERSGIYAKSDKRKGGHTAGY